MKDRSAILATVGAGVIMLMIGVAIGSAAFPTTKTETTTQRSTTTVLEHSFQSSMKTFDFDHIPYAFTVGNFSIHLANNGTFYVTHPINGTSTEYLGWVIAFNVTTPDKITNYPYFQWAGPPCPLDQSRSCTPDVNILVSPSPTNATVTYGNIATLFIQWNLNATSLYVSFIQFENISGATMIVNSVTAACIAPGQPMGMFLRILSNSSSPVVGANVTATYDFPKDCPNVSGESMVQTIHSFLSNSTEWYSLGTLNAGKYSFVVSYSGQVYDFTAQLGHGTYTCATLHLPSGIANVTTGPTACNTDTSSSTS